MLCVEDDRRLREYLGGLLREAGFVVDVVTGGESGLKAALARRHDVVLLEMSLPGFSGLEILRSMRRAELMTPVIIMTSRPTIESAIEATALHASYLTKTEINGPRIIALATSLASVEDARERPVALFGDRPDGPGSLAELSASIATLRASSDPDEARRERCLGRLSLMLVAPELTLFDFVALARAIKHLHDTSDGFERQLAFVEQLLTQASSKTWKNVDARVKDFILRMERPDTDAPHLTEGQAAAAYGLQSSSLWRLLHQELGLTFRECQRAVRARQAVRALSDTTEQVSQIAYRLGYEHASAFNRDFRRCLGTAPGVFRRSVMHGSVKD